MNRTLALAAGALAAVLSAGAAQAGSCPAQHILTEPRPIRDAPDVGVTRDILATVQLKGWRGLGDFELRTRRLVVAPRGIVPTHEHSDRPSIVYVVSGEIWEHSAHCAVPILHRAGEWAAEFGHHNHWWENRTNRPVVLTSSDVVPTEMIEDKHM
jgi:quercetin dioxygenase-like cupin family protein